MGLFNSFKVDSGFKNAIGKEEHFYTKCMNCNRVVRDDHFIKNWRHESADESEADLKKHRQTVARFDSPKKFKIFG